MTDKETIINKVNVNRCSVYKNGLCLISKEKCNAKCDYAAYYLYEQLERKEQECESLNKRASSLEEIADDLQQRNHHLTQECEALKSEGFTRESLITEQENEIDELRQKCEELKDYARRQENQREEYYKEFLKKDKALDEIKSICLKDIHTFADGTELRYDSLDEILDIINKAKGEGICQ